MIQLLQMYFCLVNQVHEGTEMEKGIQVLIYM